MRTSSFRFYAITMEVLITKTRVRPTHFPVNSRPGHSLSVSLLVILSPSLLETSWSLVTQFLLAAKKAAHDLLSPWWVGWGLSYFHVRELCWGCVFFLSMLSFHICSPAAGVFLEWNRLPRQRQLGTAKICMQQGNEDPAVLWQFTLWDVSEMTGESVDTGRRNEIQHE